MPSGAVALWNMTDYTTSPRALIPNSLATRATPTNVLLAPRRLFAKAVLNYWTPIASFTDSGQSAPDGTSDASVFTVVGNFNAGRTDNVWQLLPTEWIKAAMARWVDREAQGLPKGPMTAAGFDPSRDAGVPLDGSDSV